MKSTAGVKAAHIKSHSAPVFGWRQTRNLKTKTPSRLARARVCVCMYEGKSADCCNSRIKVCKNSWQMRGFYTDSEKRPKRGWKCNRSRKLKRFCEGKAAFSQHALGPPGATMAWPSLPTFRRRGRSQRLLIVPTVGLISVACLRPRTPDGNIRTDAREP